MESQESSEIRASRERGIRRHVRGRRRGRLVFTLVTAFVLLAGAAMTTSYALTSKPESYSFFASADVSAVTTDSDNRPVELGLGFTSRTAGTVSAVRFLRASGDQAAHRVSLWSSTRQKLAEGTSSGDSGTGWQQVTLAKPVTIQAGRHYVVSYFTSRYRSSANYFTGHTAKAGPLTTVGAGVFSYGASGFPSQTWQDSNYWVDIVFTPTGGTGPRKDDGQPEQSIAPAATETTSAPSAPAAHTSAPALPPAQSVALNLPRVPWEGGPAYYSKFAPVSAAGWTKPGFFPIAVWYEGVHTQADIALDKGAGLNTYVMLTDDSDMGLIARNGMYAMTTERRKDSGPETTGWIINDEVDMWGGAGSGTWTGNFPGAGDTCVSGKYDCGFDAMQRLSAALPSGDGRMVYANFGKGVMFWQSDTAAAKFVNNYTTVVSNDIYWYTDPNVCYSSSEAVTIGVAQGNCRRAGNYGLTVDRMRQLDAMDGKRQPVYAFVEDGHPFTDAGSPTIDADQIAGAVVNSLIHEARGVVYFNHNFGGPCVSQHVLRDACGKAIRPGVSELNSRITSLAPVLNTQSFQWKFNAQVDTMLKAYNGSYYIFAMPGRTGGTGTQKLTLPPGLTGTTAKVMFENRSVPISGGAITDSFDKEFSYHIYEITP